MKDLLSLTKGENCFRSVDGNTLCSIRELHIYLLNCNNESYIYHTDNGRNDFAKWVNDVFLFSTLSKQLLDAKTLEESRFVLMNFSEHFENNKNVISESKYFITVDGYTLTNILELYYYVLNCEDSNYSYHVTAEKNDFAKWTREVLNLQNLAQQMFLTTTKNDLIVILKDFLLAEYNSNNSTQSDNVYFDIKSQEKIIPEKINIEQIDKDVTLENTVIPEAAVSNFGKTSTPIKSNTDNALNNSNNNTNTNISNNSNNSNTTSIQYTATSNSATSNSATSNSATSNSANNNSANNTTLATNPTIYTAVNNKPVVGGLQDLSYTKGTSEIKTNPEKSSSNVTNLNLNENNSSVSNAKGSNSAPSDPEKVDLKPVLLNQDEEEEEDQNKTVLFEQSQFHSFSDEELEKFSKFGKPEKEIEEPSIKMEYLKSIYNELHNMIKELRRAEKDALVADLMLRSINPKIDYYALTKNNDDYLHIIRIMKEVQREIEEASTMQQYNLAEEIFKELRLQGLAMKKAKVST